MSLDQRATAVLAALDDALRGDPDVAALVRRERARHADPLRLAVGGMVKAGKSTLVNALIGEEIAPTDIGECTRVVTWYRFGRVPRVVLHPREGEPRPLPVVRDGGRLVLDLDGTPPEEVDRLVVDWPSVHLRDVIIVDVPGLGSLTTELSSRSRSYLADPDAPTDADALVYLLRHAHDADLDFLTGWHAASGEGVPIDAVAVLSRADELGSGRIDALVSARDIAARYRDDPAVARRVLDVRPVAGLLAQASRTLRQEEYASLVALAALPRDDRERLLLSADRLAGEADVPVPREARADLLERLGIFGVRLSLAVLRTGVPDAPALAAELTRRSGVGPVRDLVDEHFVARARDLKARATLAAVRALGRTRALPAAVEDELERAESDAHALRELGVLARARLGTLPVTRERWDAALKLVGTGSPAARLGLDDDAEDAEVRSVALARLDEWRTAAEDPRLDRDAADVHRVLERSIEGILDELDDDDADGPPSGGRPVVRIGTRTEPAGGAGQQTGDERRTG